MDKNKRQGLPVPLKSKYWKFTPYRTTNTCKILFHIKNVEVGEVIWSLDLSLYGSMYNNSKSLM